MIPTSVHRSERAFYRRDECTGKSTFT